MRFDPRLPISPTNDPLGFEPGAGAFMEPVELRQLNAIRKSLLDPDCDGPETVYAIAMDVGREQDRAAIIERDLLFGVVTYAAGTLGREPIRSQGHVHKVSRSSKGWSTPEVYEIWQGNAIILMQERDTDDPGRCFAVEAGPGEVVVVPPAWAHATISADPHQPLTFGAWCARDYGFIYDGVRAHRGLAWYPLIDDGRLDWRANPAYQDRELVRKTPEAYRQLGLVLGEPIYQQFIDDPDRFLFVPEPFRVEPAWRNFTP